MPPPQDRLGQQMGEYRLLRLLGKGAFGAVYLAEHVHDGSQVAVKLLQVQLTHPEDFKAFLNEARTIRLRHPHIVPLLDFGLSREDQPFLVMEYAAGGTLRDRHAKGSRLPLPMIVSYVQQVASALQYAHAHRVIHRDVKPENMLVRADGSLLLSDFGIATVAHSSRSLDLQEGIGGTLPYMAPGRIQGKPRPASDQYALAVVVYEWLTGQRPFQGTAVEIAMQHAMTAPPSLLELAPILSKDVEQIVLKALAKDPKERFASIEQFAQALQAAIQPPPIPAPRSASLAPAPPSVTPMLSMPILASQSPTVQPTDMGMLVEPAPSSPPPETRLPQSSMALPTSAPAQAGLPERRNALALGTRRGGVSARAILMVMLAVLILLLSGTGLWTVGVQLQIQHNQQATATAAANAYDTYYANKGIQFGFDAQHTGNNPYEHIISPANASRLHLLWSYQTGGHLHLASSSQWHGLHRLC